MKHGFIFVKVALIAFFISNGLFFYTATCYASPIRWQEGGIPIRQGNHIWWSGVTTELGGGKVLAVWSDTRTGYRYLRAQLLDETGQVWDEDITIGRQIIVHSERCRENNDERCPHYPTVQDDPVVVRATDGNAIVAWNECHYDAHQEDYGKVVLQKISPQGDLLWGAGVVISSSKSMQFRLRMLANDDGGAYVVWTHHNSRNDYDIRGLHINSDGEPYSEEWDADLGLLLARLGSSSNYPSICSDGENGFLLGYVNSIERVEYPNLTRVSPVGDILWERLTIGERGTNVEVSQVGEGIYALSYLKFVTSGRRRVFVLLIDAEGENLWEEAQPVYEVEQYPQDRHYAQKIIGSTDSSIIISWISEPYYDNGLYVQKLDFEGNRLWNENGLQVTSDVFYINRKHNLQCNGEGGAIISWEEYRLPNRYEFDVFIQEISSEGDYLWGEDGIRVTDLRCEAFGAALNQIGDNLYVVWADEREGSVSMYYQIYDGDMETFFPDNGKQILAGLSGGAYDHSIVQNGEYFYIVWVDTRYSYLGYRIMVQKIDNEGNIYFPVNGIPVSVETGTHQNSGYHNKPISVVSHHSGGIALVWIQEEDRNKYVYTQAISPQGEMLWGDEGTRVNVSDVFMQENPIISRRGESYVIVWDQTYPGYEFTYERDLAAQKIVDGFRAWGDEGIVLAWQQGPQVNHFISDVIDGEYIIWQRGDGFNAAFYAKRIDEDGNPAEGWDDYGLVFCDIPGFSQRRARAVLTDEGLLILWEDARALAGELINSSIYGQLINEDGVIQWEENGVSLADYGDDQNMISLLYDDGYAYFTWRDARLNRGEQDIAFQKIDMEGNLLWGDPAPFVVQNDITHNHPTIIKTGETLLILYTTETEANICSFSMQLASARTGETFWADEGLSLAPGSLGYSNIVRALPLVNNYALIVWADGRSSDRYGIYNLYAQKVNMFTELSVEEKVAFPSENVELYANYPNPFNPDTKITFHLPQNEAVSVKIFNVKGQLVNSLIDDEHLKSGRHSVVWNAKDTNNREVGSGIYFYKLQTSQDELIRKMLMIK